MSIENEKTVKIYEENASIYLNSSINHDNLDPERAKNKRERLENFIKTNLEKFPKNSKVFEFGCADGANAKFIKDLGYDITASDVAPDFISETKSKGINTIKFNILKDKFNEKYSAFFCWRVFVHFTGEDVLETMRKVYDALEDNGIFMFNVINRKTKSVDSEWVDFSNEYHMGAERYYKYFDKDELDNIISKTNFKIYDYHTEGGENNHKWLVYVLQK